MTIEDKIQQVLDDFGMKAPRAAKFMGISEHSFRARKTPSMLRNKFTEQNYQDLLAGIFELTEKYK
jgi:hypothetical protein